MSIFRIEKNKNYTAMSNYHLQDINLSLKAIGLLSKMLSLPDNWDYSQAGLARICKDGEDSIGSALKELEKYGYLVRERTRDANGRMSSMVYHVYEIPKDLIDSGSTITKPTQCKKTTKGRVSGRKTQKNEEQEDLPGSPQPDLPRRENPVMVNPVVDNPGMEIPEQGFPRQGAPIVGNQPQINNNIPSTYGESTYGLSTQQKSTKKSVNSINLPIYVEQEDDDEIAAAQDGLVDGYQKNEFEFYQQCVRKIREQIGYDYFEFKNKSLSDQLDEDEISLEYYESEIMYYNMRTLDQVIGYIVDVLMSKSHEPIRIGQNMVSREIVKSKLWRVDSFKIKEVMKQLATAEIKNPKGYTISMLYNA